jgi:Protein of unknown function (DUF2516)
MLAGMDFLALVYLALRLACLALVIWGLIDAATRRADAFPAASKQTKPFWLVVLGVSLGVELFFGVMSFFGIPAVVASIVYLVDVRPRVREVSRGSSW